MNSISDKLHGLRENYDSAALRKSDMSLCPVEQFSLWLEDAVNARVYDPNACTLSTVDSSGHPVAQASLWQKVIHR